jgi:hypothetical protein
VKPLIDPPPDPVPQRVRAGALVLASYVAAVHLALAEDRYNHDSRYVGASFVLGALGLMLAASVAAGGRKFRGGAKVAWAIGLVVAAGMFVSFLLSRTVGLPGYHRHDWPLIQVIALCVEAGYAALAGVALRRV